MTDVTFLNTYFTGIKDRLIQEGFQIKDLFLVRTETELAGDLKNLPANTYIMAVLIPSSDTRAQNIDNVKEQETWLIYMLVKTDPKSVTHANRITSVADQQRILTRLKQLIRLHINDGTIPCNIRPDINSMHSDPEHAYMGCDGYSLSFKVDSDDFFTSNNTLP